MHKFSITRAFIALLLSLTLVMTGFSSVSAASKISPANASAKVDGASYLRSSTSTSSKAKALLDDNTKLTIKRVIFKKKSSTSSKNKWYYVTVGSKTGYIRSDCVDSLKYTTVSGKTTTGLNYRKGAGTGMTKKGTLKKGTSVSVVLAARDSKGNDWLKIKKGSSYYYVSKKYVTPVSTTSGNSEESETKNDPSFTKSSVNYPKTLKIGETYSIKGKVTCDKKIEKVKFGIYDNNDNWVESVEKTVNAKTFDISKVDASVHFGRLMVGSYKYVGQFYVGGTWYKSVVKYSFTVTGAECTLTDKVVNTRIQEMLDVLVPGVSATNSKSTGQGYYFTTNGKACLDNDASPCNVTKVITDNSRVKNLIKNNKGSGTVKTSLFPHHYGPTGTCFTLGWSCCGFAGFAGWYIGADKVSSNVDYIPYKIGLAYNKTNMTKYARRGDLIRSSTHSCVFLDVNDSGCRVLDSNWGCTCITSVHTIKWSQSGFSKIGLSRCTIRK